MELPHRQKGDELLRPGELIALRDRLRREAQGHDLSAVVACAFDHRTRMLPFFYADLRMAPAGVRAIGSAMLDAGFGKTRVVLQQWSRRFRPLHMRLDGRVPDLFMVSSMQIHSHQCRQLIRDACRFDPAHRPLIIAGGAKTIYEPWDVFGTDPEDPWGADVAVTGEEFVLLSLLELLLSLRVGGEPIRKTFLRARNSGMLDEIPGLVYARASRDGVAEELIDTGIQRLLGDLDELPHAELGYGILEPPSGRTTLSPQPLPPRGVKRFSPIGSLVLTSGCKFACPYCPIPAYNQRKFRTKSGDRIADEMRRIQQTYGLSYFFGADDNFFNSHERAVDVFESLARLQRNREGYRRYRFRWGTEVTVHDTLKMRDHLKLARKAGVRALWLGVEDLTTTLIKKGQTADKTTEAFRLLRERGILPMPMMMHYDGQPLVSRGSLRGLVNQARVLRKAGAISLQVLMLTPATGSKLYEETYDSGMVYASADGRRVEQHMMDANYVVASRHPKPWRKQLNIMAAYLYFYNPLRFAWALVRPKTRLYLADAAVQVLGMWGLTQTVRRTMGWALRLMRGNIRRQSHTPFSRIPMRSARGEAASHALPGTPAGGYVQLTAPPAARPPMSARSTAVAGD